MTKNIPSERKEAEFALAALMEVPSQYKATIDLQLLGYLIVLTLLFINNITEKSHYSSCKISQSWLKHPRKSRDFLINSTKWSHYLTKHINSVYCYFVYFFSVAEGEFHQEHVCRHQPGILIPEETVSIKGSHQLLLMAAGLLHRTLQKVLLKISWYLSSLSMQVTT